MKLKSRLAACSLLLLLCSCGENDDKRFVALEKTNGFKNIEVHYADEYRGIVDFIEIEFGRVETFIRFDSVGKVVHFSSVIKDGEYEPGDSNYNIRFHRNLSGDFLPYSDPRTILTGVDDLSDETWNELDSLAKTSKNESN